MEKEKNTSINWGNIIFGVIFFIFTGIFFVPLLFFGILFLTEWFFGLGTTLTVFGVISLGISIYITYNIMKKRKTESKEAQVSPSPFSSDKITIQIIQLTGAATLAYQVGNFREALGYFKQIVTLDNSNTDAWRGIGEISKGLKDFQTAIHAYEKYLEISSDRFEAAEVYTNLGSVYTELNNYSKATEYFLQAIEINPNLVPAVYNLAVSYLHRKEYDKAIKNYQTAISLDVRFIRAYYGLATCYRNRGAYDKAFETYDLALKIFENNVDIMFEIGKTLEEQKKFAIAIEEYEKILTLNPNYWKAMMQIAICYHNLENKKKPIDYTLKALEINKNNPDILSNLGLFYYHDGQIENAIKILSQALEINPAHNFANKNYQLVLNDKNALEKAGIKIKEVPVQTIKMVATKDGIQWLTEKELEELQAKAGNEEAYLDMGISKVTQAHIPEFKKKDQNKDD